MEIALIQEFDTVLIVLSREDQASAPILPFAWGAELVLLNILV